MSDKTFVGLDITGFENTGKYRPVSRVTLMVDDENVYTAGDDTGLELSASCPHATQEMVNALLAQLQGYQYQSFTADAANLDPSAELGDGVTVGGVYSVISKLDDDGYGFPEVSAPGEVALEEEYPSAGPMTQEFNRQIAETRSQITKTAEEIRLEVENELEGLSASFSVQLDSITSQITGLDGQVSTIQQTVSSITSQITGLDGQVSQIEQYVDSITLSVTNGSDSSTIQLKAGSTTISSANITFNGMVTFNDLSTAGSTVINGANITTGTISADRINLTGAITWGDLDNSVQNGIDDAISTAEDAYQIASGIELPSYIKNTYIDSTRIESPTIIGGEFYAVDGNSYAKMEDDAFSLLYSGSSVPRAVLQVSNSEATLALGVGTGTDETAGRFFVTKRAMGGGSAAIMYITSRGDPIAIMFRDDGTIDFSADQVTGLYMVFD